MHYRRQYHKERSNNNNEIDLIFDFEVCNSLVGGCEISVVKLRNVVYFFSRTDSVTRPSCTVEH